MNEEGMDSPYDRFRRAGEIAGMIVTVQMLQGLLYIPQSNESTLREMDLGKLEDLVKSLQKKLRDGTS